MPDNAITIVGNITRDPEVKFLNSGSAACRFSVAVNRRWQNRQTQEWEERVSYFDVEAYGPLGENVANSVARGARVIVTGRLEQRTWETPEGEKRSAIEIKADEVGAAMSYATAVVTKTQRPEGARSTDQSGAF
jgi:single-strand DNA-binding protein